MMGDLITVKGRLYSDEVFDKIKAYILQKKIVIMPSDTIYGFLCLQECEDALRQIKRRDEKPFLLLIYDIFQLKELDIDYDDKKYLFDKYWPGPFTFLIENKMKETFGVRMPDCSIMKRIIKSVNCPLLSTSVNYSNQEALNNFDEIRSNFSDKADLIINDEDYKPDTSSAVVDIRNKPYKIIRKGSIDFND